jgi:Caspase domain
MPFNQFLCGVLTVICMFSVHAKDHVLILTISDYLDKPLPGVKHDADSALKIAASMGYDTSDVQMFKDRQLTESGMRRVLAEIPDRVQSGDRVFFYYSGHGASILQGNQCVQALVSQDARMIGLQELSRSLDLIKAKTSDVMVIMDACHSGGLQELASVTRSGVVIETAQASPVSAKVWTARQGEVCHTPSNYAKEWDVDVSLTRSMVMPQNNFVLIAAANEREVALDDSQRGGLATTALLDCLQNGVVDTDGSGAVSAKELAACAQQRVAQEVPKINARSNMRFTPHTVEVHGNTARALSIRPIQTAVVGLSDAERTRRAFEQIVASSNGNWPLGIDMPTSVRLGDSATIRYSSAYPGYASMFYVGSDNKDIQMIFGNLLKPATNGNMQTIGVLPITAPAGANTFLFVMSAAPLNTEMLLASAKDDKVKIDVTSIQRLQCEMKSQRNAGKFVAQVNDGCEQKRNVGNIQFETPASGQTGLKGIAAQVLTVVGRQ